MLAYLGRLSKVAGACVTPTWLGRFSENYVKTMGMAEVDFPSISIIHMAKCESRILMLSISDTHWAHGHQIPRCWWRGVV